MQISYSEETKARILRRVDCGDRLIAICTEEGIDESTLRRWRRKRGKPSQAHAIGKTVEDRGSIGLPPEREDKTDRGQKSIVLVLPDLHSPAVHPDAIPFLQAVRQRFKPNVFLQLGDEVDFQALSRFPKNPDMHSAGAELSAAIEGLIPFYKEFPNMKICVSNHTSRSARAAFGAGIPRAFLKHISMVLNAPDGWEWAEEWEIDGTMYFHGDRGKSGQYAHIGYLKGFKKNVVIGHIHAWGGVNWEGPHFAMNTGCLIDPNTTPLEC
jgi:hypothetical protein